MIVVLLQVLIKAKTFIFVYFFGTFVVILTTAKKRLIINSQFFTNKNYIKLYENSFIIFFRVIFPFRICFC
jgi:hypothetical protein